MNIALACVLVAGILPIVAAIASKWGFHGYDNRNPRAWLAAQTGTRARANAAQANSWEAFPFFAAGVLAALWAQVPQARIDLLAAVFIVARVLYLVFYLTVRATLRSLVWTIGWACCVALYVSAL